MNFQFVITSGKILIRVCPIKLEIAEKLRCLFTQFDQKFPAEEGYTLVVHRFPERCRYITRERFSKLCEHKCPDEILRSFFNDRQIIDFILQRQFLSPETAKVEHAIAIPTTDPPVTTVLFYGPGLYLLEAPGSATRYIFPGDHDQHSNDLEALEWELFLRFLENNHRPAAQNPSTSNL